MSRPRINTQRPYVYSRTTAKGDVMWNANVRSAHCETTYLATTTDKAQALAICERYIATGERPPKAKRGPKGRRSGMPARKPKAINPKPKPAPKMSHEDRIAMMRGILARIG